MRSQLGLGLLRQSLSALRFGSAGTAHVATSGVGDTLRACRGHAQIRSWRVEQEGEVCPDCGRPGEAVPPLIPLEIDRVSVVGATWQPINLGPFMDGTHVRPQATIGIARTDDVRLLYPGKEHAVIGEMESGKSWLALGCVVPELLAGRRVVYVHFEEADPSDTVERLQLLGVPDEAILERFAFVGPNEPVDTHALAALLDPAPSLVVLDGVNEAMSVRTMGIRDEDGAAAFRRRIVKPCTAVGAATLACDHVVKDRERRGRERWAPFTRETASPGR